MEKITVKDVAVSVIKVNDEDYISLTDMLKAKDGEFFFSNWLRNRNTVEFLGIWEKLVNPDFNYAEFDIIKTLSESYPRQDAMAVLTPIKILHLSLPCGSVPNSRFI